MRGAELYYTAGGVSANMRKRKSDRIKNLIYGANDELTGTAVTDDKKYTHLMQWVFVKAVRIVMQGPIDLNPINPCNNFYSWEVGIYYVIKKKHIIFYYENGRPGKNGMLQSSKNYAIARTVNKKDKCYLIGECLPYPFVLVCLLIEFMIFPIGFLIGLLLLYIFGYGDFKEILSFLDNICSKE